MKFDIWVFFENLSRQFELDYKMTRITDTLHEDLGTFMTTSRLILPIMKKISDKFTDKIKTYFMVSNRFPKIVPFSTKTMVEADRPQMTM
jgi:hypothetical protein